jgi:hypothetical protein
MECWTLDKQQESQIDAAEMRFLRAVAGSRRTDGIRNKAIRQVKHI